MKVITTPEDYQDRTAGSIIIHVLRENKRPVGFARDWPEPEPKKKKRKKK